MEEYCITVNTEFVFKLVVLFLAFKLLELLILFLKEVYKDYKSTKT